MKNTAISEKIVKLLYLQFFDNYSNKSCGGVQKYTETP